MFVSRKHASFYLRSDPEGFWVIGPYKRNSKVESRKITVKSAKDRAQANYTPSDDAAMFYVIETP